jgi:hypothetical protein
MNWSTPRTERTSARKPRYARAASLREIGALEQAVFDPCASSGTRSRMGTHPSPPSQKQLHRHHLRCLSSDDGLALRATFRLSHAVALLPQHLADPLKDKDLAVHDEDERSFSAAFMANVPRSVNLSDDHA